MKKLLASSKPTPLAMQSLARIGDLFSRNVQEFVRESICDSLYSKISTPSPSLPPSPSDEQNPFITEKILGAVNELLEKVKHLNTNLLTISERLKSPGSPKLSQSMKRRIETEATKALPLQAELLSLSSQIEIYLKTSGAKNKNETLSTALFELLESYAQISA